MEQEILTTEEALKYFRITKVTLLRLIHEGKIRAFKVGRAYRFKKTELEEDLRVNENLKVATR
ncbi:MAG: helix-turn-helix domain-containing protein [bacterium]